MPIVKFFCHDPQPTAAAAETLAARVEALCRHELAASPDAIEVLLVPSLVLRGPQVLVEAHFRAQPHRGPQAVERFMDGLEEASIRHLGRRPRIRCFPVDGNALGARN
ncbi:MAG: hypothetical protein J0H69_23475 [Burkholderiales bacterium]|jgi:hypothetical protein|nr:hypothetical protein [Burkholderiales bacterium]